MSFRSAWHAYSWFHYRVLNFLARRVVAPAFVVIGGYAAAVNASALLPGGSTLVNGTASTDLVFRISAVVLPLVIAVLGVALYRMKPFVPSAENGDA